MGWRILPPGRNGCVMEDADGGPLRAFHVVGFCAAAQAELSHFTHPTGALRL